MSFEIDCEIKLRKDGEVIIDAQRAMLLEKIAETGSLERRRTSWASPWSEAEDLAGVDAEGHRVRRSHSACRRDGRLDRGGQGVAVGIRDPIAASPNPRSRTYGRSHG